MPTTTTFPNGTTLVSSALTQDQINTVFQQLFTSCLGLTNTSPTYNSAVRIAWQTDGNPAWKIGTDVLSIRCSEEDGEYNKIRDFTRTPYLIPNGGYGDGKYNTGGYGEVPESYTQVQNTYEYTRIWRIGLVARGPSAVDNIRLVKSCLFLSWVHDILSSNNLYINPRLSAGLRTPELYQGRWWEVVSFSFLVNEQITETTQVNSVQSVEVILDTDRLGQVLDQTYSAP